MAANIERMVKGLGLVFLPYKKKRMRARGGRRIEIRVREVEKDRIGKFSKKQQAKENRENNGKTTSKRKQRKQRLKTARNLGLEEKGVKLAAVGKRATKVLGRKIGGW